MISFKITMKKTILNFLLALLPLAANAEPVEVDGIWYELNDVDPTAIVVKSGDAPYSGAIEIPNSISYNNKNYIVISIGEEAFAGCDALTSVTLRPGIESIEQGGFYECVWLESVNIPNGVKKIGLGAFSGCERLPYVSIPSSVTEIGKWAFDRCPQLKRIDCNIKNPFAIDETVFKLNNGGYDDNYIYSTAMLVVPDGTKPTYQETEGWKKFVNIVEEDEIGQGGKAGDIFKSGLLYYRIGANNTVVVTPATSEEDKYAGDIEIPGQVEFNGKDYSVTGISNSAFKGCAGLTSVTIPQGITTISPDAFYGCSNLASINIPSTITTINSNAFLGCSNLSSVYITDLAAWCNINFANFNANPLSYASLFLNKKKIVDLEIPNDVTTISNSAFRGLKNILSVKIPGSVISIGKDAFWGCSSLISIISDIEKPFAIDDDVFTSNDKDIYATALLIVPVGKRSDYMNTDGWKKFTNIEENPILCRDLRYANLIFKNVGNGMVSLVEARCSGDYAVPSSVIIDNI